MSRHYQALLDTAPADPQRPWMAVAAIRSAAGERIDFKYLEDTDGNREMFRNHDAAQAACNRVNRKGGRP